MGDIGKALKAAAAGVAQGISLGLRGEELEQRKDELEFAKGKWDEEKVLREIGNRVKEKQAAAMQSKADAEKMTVGIDLLETVIGQQEISPNQKDALIKSFNEKHGLDISSIFMPNKDEKTGVVNSFRLENVESIKNKLDAENKKTELEIEKYKAVSDRIDAQAALRSSNPKTAMAWFVNHKEKLDPDEVIDFATKLKMAEATGSQLEWEYDPQGNLIGVKSPFGKIKKPVHSPGFGLALEKKMANITEQIFQVSEIEASQFKEILTWPGQFKNFTLKTLDKMSTKDLTPEQKEFIGKANVFRANLGRFFDTYRIFVTGAQAAMKELDMLRQRVLNEDLTKGQFEYMMQDTKAKLNRTMRLYRMIGRQGLSENEFLAKFNSAVDTAITTGEDPSLSTEETKNRFDELKEAYIKSGRPEKGMKKFVVEQMRKEGYMQ